MLYGNPDPSRSQVYYLQESGSIDPSTQEQRFQRLEQRLGVTTSALTAADLTIRLNGELETSTTVYPSDISFVANPDAFNVSTTDGNLIPGMLIGDHGSGVTADLAGGSVIASGGGNVIASGGGNVIASGGGNIIRQAGTN